MKKRRVTTPWGLGELPLSPVENKSGWESRKDYFARLEREEQERQEAEKRKAEAPLLAVQQEISKNLQRLRAAQRENLFLIPSPELAEQCSHVPENVPGTVDEIREQIKHAITTGLTGIPIHESGIKKVREIARLNPTIDIRQPENWRKIVEYAISLNALDANDVTVPQPLAPVAAEPEVSEKPTMNDLMNLRVTGSRDLPAARELADKLYESEMLPIYGEWVNHLLRDHNYRLTREDADIIEKWFVRNNKARLRHESYNEARRWMISQGRWPETMLSSDEQLSRLVETTALNSYDAKQDLLCKMVR